MNALKEEIIKRDIECIEEVMITSLVTDGDEVIGATGLNLKDSSLIYFKAKSTILASGGAGQLYPVTSNTFQKNGDGYAISYRAGADLVDMEQVQFHPTGMVSPKSKRGVLVTEAVRAEGGILLNSEGERIMSRYAPEKMELATRDVVARSIYQEIIEGRGTENGGVYLDISHLDDDYIDETLETMVLQFENIGIDIKSEPIEVAPTAHHFMGGLKINTDASTSLKNLFGAGEVCGGVHGANRLGGNALADTQVFGKIAGESASKACKNTELKTNDEQVNQEASRIDSLIKKGSIKPKEFKDNIKNLMWENVAIVREEKTLNEALKQLLEMQKDLDNLDVGNNTQYNTDLVTALEVINMVEICILIVKSAILRRESRGAHFRSDFPESIDEWKKSIIMNKKEIKFEAR
jgi:fumarate reductase (CoM/CoB) subunit A